MIQTGNMKRALRKASARCQIAGALPGDRVTVWVLGICDTDPFIAGLVETHEHALPLIDGVVFLVETARFGVRHHTREGYVPLDAQDFVRSVTRSTDSPAEASAILEPFFEAVGRLP
jgi:hypothetical protein